MANPMLKDSFKEILKEIEEDPQLYQSLEKDDLNPLFDYLISNDTSPIGYMGNATRSRFTITVGLLLGYDFNYVLTSYLNGTEIYFSNSHYPYTIPFPTEITFPDNQIIAINVQDLISFPTKNVTKFIFPSCVALEHLSSIDEFVLHSIFDNWNFPIIIENIIFKNGDELVNAIKK